MPAQFTKHFVQDLQQDIKIRQCGTIVFNTDNLSNVISVDLYNGTEEYSGGGSVAGACICPDGSTVALTGSISGKTASVVLTGDCFAFPGQIGIGVQVVSGTVKTTVLKAIYNVELFETDDMVDPGSRITASVGQLVADIEAATAEIPASDMASLMSGIAPTFSASTNYAAGAYVYDSGTLYRFTADHAAGSWTGTDATAVALGNDVISIKNDVIKFVGDCPATGFDINTLTQNGIWTIRASRKSVCTNLPDGTVGALTIVTQQTANNVSWQRVYDANNSIWSRTVNTTTYAPITNWSNNIVQETGTETSVAMSQKSTTDALALKADQSALSAKANQTDLIALQNKVVSFVEDCPASGYNTNQLVTNGIWTIRSGRKSACTNLPADTNGSLVLIVRTTNTNVAFQTIIDEVGTIYIKNVNSSTYETINDWKVNIEQSTGNYAYRTMSQKSITDGLNSKIDSNKLDTVFVDGNPVITDKVLTYVSNNTIASTTSNNYITYKFPVSKGSILKVTGATRGSSNNPCIIADANNAYLGVIGSASSDTTTYTNEILTITQESAAFAYICLFKANGVTIEVHIQSYKTAYDDEQNNAINRNLIIGNQWQGKTIVTFGDSRTWYDGNTYGDTTKAPWTGEKCVGYQQTMIKLLGATIIKQGFSGYTSAQICEQIRAYNFTGVDAVLLEGGVNDFVKSSQVTIGEIAPIGSTFDTTTVYGAWQSAIEYIETNYPSVRIYMTIPAIAWIGSNDDVFPYAVAEIKGKIAELYNIPCKDLYKEGGINIVNRDYYYVDDPAETNNWHLHFNDYGNALIGAEIAQFMNAN